MKSTRDGEKEQKAEPGEHCIRSKRKQRKHEVYRDEIFMEVGARRDA